MSRITKQGKQPGLGGGSGAASGGSPEGRPRAKSRRVNVDCPPWMVERLDEEADRLGVSRQSLIKFWLAERLDKLVSD